MYTTYELVLSIICYKNGCRRAPPIPQGVFLASLLSGWWREATSRPPRPSRGGGGGLVAMKCEKHHNNVHTIVLASKSSTHAVSEP